MLRAIYGRTQYRYLGHSGRTAARSSRTRKTHAVSSELNVSLKSGLLACLNTSTTSKPTKLNDFDAKKRYPPSWRTKWKSTSSSSRNAASIMTMTLRPVSVKIKSLLRSTQRIWSGETLTLFVSEQTHKNLEPARLLHLMIQQVHMMEHFDRPLPCGKIPYDGPAPCDYARDRLCRQNREAWPAININYLRFPWLSLLCWCVIICLSHIQSFGYVCHDCGENNRNSIPNGHTVGQLVYKLIMWNNSGYIRLIK